MAEQQAKAWGSTDVGQVRDHNEDSYLIDHDNGLYAVADGMGGHAAGEVASAMALEVFARMVRQHRKLLDEFAAEETRELRKDVMRMLDDGVRAACADVHAAGRADPDKRGMGTTLCALVLAGPHAFVAHVGDSRIYLVRQGKAHQLTQDHSLENELLKRGKLTKEQIERVDQKGALTRAIGVYPSVNADTMMLDVLPGDRLMICSDGLYAYLHEGDLTAMFEGDAEGVADRLVALANERGGHDNITAIVLAAPDQGDEARVEEVQLKLQTLQKMPLFNYLNYQELVRISNLTTVRHFVADEPIFREGDPGEELFVVLTGQVKVHKADTEITRLGDGEQFGEMALVDRSPRSADVTACSDTRVLVMKRADFFQIIRHEREMAVKLLWRFVGVLTERLRNTSRELGEARGQLAIEDLTHEIFEDMEPEVKA